jgi:UDP-N-acetylmuramyl pentapeptide synthase
MEVGGRLREYVKPGDWLLFKGSRGMKMERVLKALKHGKV